MATTRRWGFSEEEWAEARRALEELLTEAGRSRSTVTYGEVARRALGGRVSARSSALMDLLGEVDTEADARLGCMVASLVAPTSASASPRISARSRTLPSARERCSRAI